MNIKIFIREITGCLGFSLKYSGSERKWEGDTSNKNGTKIRCIGLSTFCVCEIFHNKKIFFKIKGKKRQEFTTKSKFGHYSWVLKNCRKPLTKQTPKKLTVAASKNCREILWADFFCQQTFSLQHSWELCFLRSNVLLPRCKQDVLIPNWTLPASFPWENLSN